MMMCVAGSSVLTVVSMVLAGVFAGSGGWFAVGPSERLVVAGVVIDSAAKYWTVVLVIVANASLDMILKEFAGPILGFNVYNPDKRVITGGGGCCVHRADGRRFSVARGAAGDGERVLGCDESAGHTDGVDFDFPD
jgi:hypothetical protein